MGDASVNSIKNKSNEFVLGEIPDDSRSTSQYQMKPNLKEGFQEHAIKEIISNVLIQILDGKQYQGSLIQEWTGKISDTISSQIKELNMRRYKHIVQVVIVQQTGAGCKYIARCRWDAECDVQVSNYFTNETMACIVTVFGVYIMAEIVPATDEKKHSPKLLQYQRMDGPIICALALFYPYNGCA